jgi:nicotinamide phosphoribosyltransferase
LRTTAPCRYPTTVATLSRRGRDIIAAAFEISADGGASSPLLASRLHDFGFRGCTSMEQSVLGGCAHLINFDGTDTMSAAYYAQVRGMWVKLGMLNVLRRLRG